MKLISMIVALGLLASLILACGGEAAEPTVAPTVSTGSESTQVPTQPAATEAPAPTAAPQPTLAPTATPESTSIPVPTAVPTATALPEPTPAPAPTTVPTSTPQPTATVVPTATPEPTPTQEPMATPTTEPPSDPDAAESLLAPLGDNLQWVAHFDNRTKEWSVFDPSGSFSPDLLPLVGQSTPDPSDINELSKLLSGEIYWVLLKEPQSAVIDGVSMDFPTIFSPLRR